MFSTFLWNLEDISAFEYAENVEMMESFFNKVFSPYKVLYLSRARHFIPYILQYENLKRRSIIFTPPYSSHCVLSNISLQSTPSIINDTYIDASLIYHQYGNKEIVDRDQYKNILIEDSVDSTFLDISEDELFPNGGKYNLISLSKIMKLPLGAILVCKNDNDYEGLKELIDQSINRVGTQTTIYDELKKDNYTKEAILSEFKLITPVVSDIESLYSESISTMKSNINVMTEYFNLNNLYSKRLPSNILLDQEYSNYEKISGYIQEQSRNIYDYTNEVSNIKKLIPVHCGIEWDKILK